jgi:hypothetical protein
MPWIDFNLPGKGKPGKRKQASIAKAIRGRDRAALGAIGAAKPVRLNVVGGAYDNEDGSSRQAEAALLVVGEAVELRREPTNKHDPSAVAVFSERGVQLGYLGASRASWIGSKLDRGLVTVAVVDRIVGRAGERKPVIRIEISAAASPE